MSPFDRCRLIAMAKRAVPRSAKPRDVAAAKPYLDALHKELGAATILELLQAPYDVVITSQDVATALAVFGVVAANPEQLTSAAAAVTARRRIAAGT